MPKNESKVFSLRIPIETFKKIEVISEANSRSINGEMAFMLKEAIRLYEKKNGEIVVSAQSDEQ